MERSVEFILQPWHLLLAAFAGWVNREQQAVIDYLRAENQVLKEAHGKRRIKLNDNQRRRLAVKGKALGRKILKEIGAAFSPDTILRWHRMLIARKWDYVDCRQSHGRPRIIKIVVDLILRIARENPTWGCDRIQGVLENLGYLIGDTTIGNILKEHGIDPAPERKRQMTWATFLKAHWEVLAAIDFTTIEVWTKGGLVTYYLLFAIELSTRRVHFAGCTTNPHEGWIKQVGRNLTDPDDGFLPGPNDLIMDRDTKFCDSFRSMLRKTQVKPVRLPPQSPNLNAYIERFMRSLKEECLYQLIFFGEGSVRRAVKQFLEHYHRERNHQGLDNRLIDPPESLNRRMGKVRCRERLGGILKYYYRDAA
ncbi:MAG: DDE-type integrase/transposase/recombinase [Candidatus Eisenbacteria bacterium]|uniref:DDE-type integrase/transposase/recombinase n=1 Tax=Eiseniibacteriota bacterium TaxID=2212470 RepID=A0A948RSW0_UNCEI|nr:DDE-type integrase/transposase/recombinase [Candidatus Eisenbacteria bacterium]MBU2690393.1 DDE-type integrase/transposase/recombinase [Candidatus Eisenbacteria bacterium]